MNVHFLEKSFNVHIFQVRDCAVNNSGYIIEKYVDLRHEIFKMQENVRKSSKHAGYSDSDIK